MKQCSLFIPVSRHGESNAVPTSRVIPLGSIFPPSPPLTHQQQVEAAEEQKKQAQALEKATKAIGPLQDADLGIATAQEKADLIAWKRFHHQGSRYRVASAAALTALNSPYRTG